VLKDHVNSIFMKIVI